jgi:hypothetical protein
VREVRAVLVLAQSAAQAYGDVAAGVLLILLIILCPILPLPKFFRLQHRLLETGSNENAKINTSSFTDAKQISNTRPFTTRRMIKPGGSIVVVPSVVKCAWTPLHVD